MANVKFSEFPSAATVGATDIIPILQGGVNKKATALIFSDYIGSAFVGLTGAQTVAGVKTFSSQLISTVAIGTAPFSVVSTTKVTNLNADLLDGLSSADFASAASLSSYLPLAGGTLTGALNGTSATFTDNVLGTGLVTRGSTLNNNNNIKFLRAGNTEMAYIGWANENTNNSTWLFKSSNANPIAFSADSINQNLFISSAGNVGIGTEIPYNKLQVLASDSSNIIGGSASSINITNSNADAFGRTSDLIFSVGDGISANKLAAISSVYKTYGTSVGGDLVLSTNNGLSSLAEKMRIFANGNVGINTGGTDAGYKLDVNGTARVSGAATFSSSVTTGGNLTITGSSNLGNEATNVTAGGYTTRISGASLLSGALYYGSYGSLILNTNNEYTSSSRRFLFTNALDGTKFAIVRSANATTDPSFGADGVLTSGTADFVITNTGNVLIGTTTNIASSKLTIDSTTQGVLVPRMTTTQINAISSPANGLIAYNTTLATLCFYDGSGWRKVSHSSM